MAYLSKDQVKQIIQNAPSGTNPAGIVAALRQKGHQLEGFGDTQNFSPVPTGAPQEPGMSLSGFASNIAGSAGRMVGGIAQAVMSPIETAKTLGSVALGGAQKLVPGEQGQERNFDAVANFFKERYGITELAEGKISKGVNKIVKTIYEDPIGFLGDLSTVIGGAGVVAKGAQIAGAGAKAGKVASLARTVSEVTNPISLPSNLLSPLTSRVFPKLSQRLAASNFRLTANQLARGGESVNKAAELFTKLGIRTYKKATEVYDKFEDSVQDFLQIKAKGRSVSVDYIRNRLDELKVGYAEGDIANLNAVNKQIDVAKRRLAQYGADVPLDRLNRLKRNVAKEAFNKTGDSVLDWVEHDIADVYKNILEDNTRDIAGQIGGLSLEEFNQNYSLLIKGRQWMKYAEHKPQLSSITLRIMGGLVGSMTGGPGGAAAGAALAPSIFKELPIAQARGAAAGYFLKPPSPARIPSKVGVGLYQAGQLNQTQK